MAIDTFSASTYRYEINVDAQRNKYRVITSFAFTLVPYKCHHTIWSAAGHAVMQEKESTTFASKMFWRGNIKSQNMEILKFK